MQQAGKSDDCRFICTVQRQVSVTEDTETRTHCFCRRPWQLVREMCDWGLRPAHKKNFRRVRRADHASLWQHASSWEWRASYDLPGAGKMVQNTICMVSPLNAPQEEQPAPGRWEDYIISQGLATTCVFSRPTMPPSATASSWEQRALHDLPGAGKWAQTTPSAWSAC
ncbi:uncharacterized protein N7479_005828 [Penicillium vulpinum]|uniref:uncharacterized protein n=1 Tax=Penicillium vulpinum TaxID=29845 RepID=UPI0025483746|nr:uncharacterized protein N7479_005828 [Penicillium vulpinum]KAJ5958678.1 hypothetical protein N7479_005828 [Penicillium vulpinum]